MSELCPGVPLQIETISNLNLKIPYLTDEFWQGYPNLKAYHLQEFFAMLRSEDSKEVPINEALKESPEKEQEHQKQELMNSIKYLRENCELIQ